MSRIESRATLTPHTDGTLRALVHEHWAPGIAYMVVTPDAVMYRGRAGVVDADTGQPVTDNTLFMGYSTTKALTSIVVMQLVESGQLELDAPLSRHVADHPYGDALTLRMLLAHTGGVPNPMPLDWFFVEGEPVDREAALAQVLADHPKLSNPPGSAHGYTNLGYWLLERAIEHAAGKPYAEVVRERVLAPLGIAAEDATFELPSEARLARGHLRKWSWQTPVFYLLSPWRYWDRAVNGWSRFKRLRCHGLAYGGLYVTPSAWGAILSDLLRRDGRLLSAASKQALFAPQSTRDGRATGEALGWVLGELSGVRYVGKQGGGLGFHGNLRLYPDLGIATVVFANATRVSAGPVDTLSDRLDGPIVDFLHAAQP